MFLKFLVFCCLGFVGASLMIPFTNNVCRNLQDYSTFLTNRNCYYNPDVNLPLPSIAKRYGFYLEKYRVTTEDGFILTIFRMLKSPDDSNNKRRPILLQHGIGITASVWMLLGKKSLAFNLVNRGFDVWLSNARGTKFSSFHLKYNQDDPGYWDFSFHEMGVYDLPANLDFIRNVTNYREKVIYVGHSMGTTLSYVYASVLKEHAEENVKALISIAPVANFNQIRSVAKLAAPVMGLLENWIIVSGFDYFLRHPEISQPIVGKFCSSPAFVMYCQILHRLLAGFNPEQEAAENLPLFFKHFLTGTSLKTLKHYGQILLAHGRFQWYDNGKEVNKILYENGFPPEYDLEGITVPVHLFVGRDDFLGDERDVQVLYEKLNNSETTYRVVSKDGDYNFAHNDFVMGKHVEVFYDELYALLDKI